MFAEFVQTVGHGMGKKKKKMILLFVGSAVFCLVGTSFYSEVISGKWGREGGRVDGWVDGWAVVEDCERLLGCEGCCNRRR